MGLSSANSQAHFPKGRERHMVTLCYMDEKNKACGVWAWVLTKRWSIWWKWKQPQGRGRGKSWQVELIPKVVCKEPRSGLGRQCKYQILEVRRVEIWKNNVQGSQLENPEIWGPGATEGAWKQVQELRGHLQASHSLFHFIFMRCVLSSFDEKWGNSQRV